MRLMVFANGFCHGAGWLRCCCFYFACLLLACFLLSFGHAELLKSFSVFFCLLRACFLVRFGHVELLRNFERPLLATAGGLLGAIQFNSKEVDAKGTTDVDRDAFKNAMIKLKESVRSNFSWDDKFASRDKIREAATEAMNGDPLLDKFEDAFAFKGAILKLKQAVWSYSRYGKFASRDKLLEAATDAVNGVALLGERAKQDSRAKAQSSSGAQATLHDFKAGFEAFFCHSDLTSMSLAGGDT